MGVRIKDGFEEMLGAQVSLRALHRAPCGCWRSRVSLAAMVHQLHECCVHLADRPHGPAAPHLPAENPHQDSQGKHTRCSQCPSLSGGAFVCSCMCVAHALSLADK